MGCKKSTVNNAKYVALPQISPLMALEPPAGGWHLPRPESEEQTLASYIGSGSFSRHQGGISIILIDSLSTATGLSGYYGNIMGG